MAAGGTVGVVTVWNLEERRLATIVKDAHDAPVVALHFFAGAASTAPPPLLPVTA
jgi:U3 small nucleolar RNA-associated protein 21